MDIQTIISFIFILLLCLAISIYLLAYYCHPEDKGFGNLVYCKVIVVLGFTLIWLQAFLIPIDIENMKHDNDTFDMKTLYFSVYMIMAVLIVIIIPYCIFFYETDPDYSYGKRLLHAFFYELGALAISAMIIFISWAVLNKADIPVQVCYINYEKGESNVTTASSFSTDQITDDISLEIKVSFAIYLIGLISFVGWVFFIIFAGVGLTALPLDLIIAWFVRPVARSAKEMSEKKQMLKQHSIELINIGSSLKDKEIELTHTNGWLKKRKVRNQLQKKYNDWMSDVIAHQQEHAIFKDELDIMNTSQVKYYLQLILGIVFFIITFMWILHIIFYFFFVKNGFAMNNFMNDILNAFSNSGIIILSGFFYGFLTLYLLWCTIKGNFKFGVRIPFMFTLHPMKPNETFMNSFLFNILVLLISSFAVTQFTQQAFSEYCRNTQIQMIFQNQIQHLRFYKYFFENNVFIYILLGWSLITLIYLLIKPKDKAKGVVR